MNLAALRTELQARGFQYLDSGRLTQFVNDGYHGICEWDSAQWPFLEATTTGSAPLTISDLREILYVVDSATLNRLKQADSRDIVDLDVTVATAGSPLRYWLDGMTTLRVWPTNTTDSLSVRYIKVPTDLSADADVPVVPVRYHSLIVDHAEVFALQDRSDYQEAQQLYQGLAARVAKMESVVMTRNDDDPDFIVVTNRDDQGPRWCS